MIRLLPFILLLSCSSEWSKPYKICLEKEEYNETIFVKTGATMTPMTTKKTRCISETEEYYITNDELGGRYRLVPLKTE